MNKFIPTYTNRQVDPFDLKPEDIDIRDIAQGLSMLCRYAGHVEQHYSVAQHSVMVCDMLPYDLKFTGLLHDASEAYIVDLPAPVKDRLPEYRKLEDKVMKAISSKFGFTYPLPQEVVDVDKWMFRIERSFIMKKYYIQAWDAETAYCQFIDRFRELKR